MNSVLQAKHLFNTAISHYSPVDTLTYGVTVSLLQDSAEMLVWAMAKHFNIPSKAKDGFVQLVSLLDSQDNGIDLKQQIFELNQARVSFKHYGNIPLGEEVLKYIKNCENFLRLNSKRMGIDFETLTSVDTVQHLEIKDQLKESERFLSNDDYVQALVHSSVAFKLLEDLAQASLDLKQWDMRNIEDAYRIWPEEGARRARDFTKSLSIILEKLAEHATHSRFGVPIEYSLQVKNLCYQVVFAQSGKVHWTRRILDKSEPDEARIRNINRFIIDASRKV